MRRKLSSIALVAVMILMSLSFLSGSGSEETDIWAGGPSLTEGGISPESGWPGNTTFDLYVNYSDSAGLAPAVVYAVIDGDANTMNVPSGNYYTGVNCTLSLNRINPGNHTLFYVAVNTSYQNSTYARYPAIGNLTFSVLGSNYYPNLNNSYHYPHTPEINQTVMFETVYTDPGGDAPMFVNVVIDGQSYNMTVSGTNYKVGVWCYYNHSFDSGLYHTYFFDTMDNNSDRNLYFKTDNFTLTTRVAPELYNGSVTPENGDALLTNFTFNVGYKNLNGDRPYSVYVVVDNHSYYMNQVYDNNYSYVEGVNFTTTRTFLSGSYNYYFYANNRYTVDTRLPETGYYHFNATGNYTRPELYNASITPESGNSSTIFSISVYYRDADNDPPMFVAVNAYTGENEINITMNTAGTDYRNGTFCYVNTTLPLGKYYLHFHARDITNLYDSTYVELNVTVMDGDSFGKLSNGYADPNPAVQNTAVNFTVDYYDPMGRWPDYVYLVLDGEAYYMWDEWTNVSTFTYRSIIYQNLSSGDHDFYFIGRDSYEFDMRYPEEGNLTLHIYDHLPKLMDPGISPKVGNDQDTFKFWITYMDEKGLTPSSMELYIGNSTNSMSSTQTTYKTGANYSYSTSLSTGRHYYYFLTKLSNGAFARYPAKGELHIDVDGHTGLISRQLIPNTGDTDTLFNFTIKYVDTNGMVPSYVRVFIDNDYYNMTITGTDYVNGTICYHTTKLDLGNHTYYYEALNSKRSYRSPSPGNYYKIHVSAPDEDHSPILSSGRVSPVEGNSSTSFTFRIAYSDPDGNAPNAVSVLINEVEHEMNVSGTDYENGVNCTYSTKLPTGNHTYYFIAYDSTNLSARYPTLTSMKLSVSDGGSSIKPDEKKPPVAGIIYSVSGKNATLDGSRSFDPDGKIVSYSWHIGGSIYTGMYRNISFTEPGYYTAKLVVVDNDGYSDSDIVHFWAYDKTSQDDPHDVGGVITVDDTGSETDITKNGTSISVKESDEDSITFSVSTSGDDNVVIMEVGKDKIKVGDDEVLQIKIDGSVINATTDLESVLTSSSDEPIYYIVDTGDSYRIVLYLPDETDSEVDLSVVEGPGDEGDDNGFIWLALLVAVVVVILVLVVLIGVSRQGTGSDTEEMYDDLDEIDERYNDEE